jgi:glycosyltransferase involved in cell wall biosynthesis
VGHDASRTGAPVLLASGLRWAAANVAADAQMRLVLLEGGPLLEEYRRSVPTRALNHPMVHAAMGAGAALRSVGLWAPRDDALESWSFGPSRVGDVVVANTLVALPLATRLARRGGASVRLVCHVHELDGVASRVLADREQRDRLVGRVDAFIAAGPAVGQMLVERWGISVDRVNVVDPWVDGAARSAVPPRRRERQRPIVLSIGAMHRRKGPDRFVDLISLLVDHPLRPRGVWAGSTDPSSPVAQETRSDIERCVAPDVVEVVAHTEDLGPLLRSADLVVSTALEDPFPLALLEAAAAGVPVAGFAAGGLGTMLAAVGQADAAVPVDDVIGLARVVTRLLDDPAERRRRGRALAEWVDTTHLTPHLAPSWWEVIAP